MRIFLRNYASSRAAWWFRATLAKTRLAWLPSSLMRHLVRHILRLLSFVTPPHYCQITEASRVTRQAHTLRPYYTET
eukprot:636622-Pyramimonas_sp.AAC.1